MRKTTRGALTALLVAGMLVLAGCSAQPGLGGESTTEPGDATPATTTDDSADGADGGGSGTVHVYLSDERNAIDRFAHLNVTVTAVSFRSADAGAGASVGADADADAGVDAASGNGSIDANATASVDAGGEVEAEANADADWRSYEVDGRSVDLTRLPGEYATRLGALALPEGEYTAVRLDVTEVEGTLKSGERVTVKLPSGGLTLHETFAVDAGTETDFVFDATVFEAGTSGKYVLKPVAGESGVGRPVRLVDGGATDGAASANASVATGVEANASGSEAGINVTAGANVSGDLAVEVAEAGLSGVTVAITNAGEPVSDATVAVDGEVVGETDADGRVTVPLPEQPVVDVTVATDEETYETTVDLNAYLGANASGAADANA